MVPPFLLYPGGGTDASGKSIVTTTNNGSGKVLVTTAGSHGLSTSNSVTITGNSVVGYNTTSVITVLSATTFSLNSVAYTSDGTGGTWA